jgi:hypothetical protein
MARRGIVPTGDTLSVSLALPTSVAALITACDGLPCDPTEPICQRSNGSSDLIHTLCISRPLLVSASLGKTLCTKHSSI